MPSQTCAWKHPGIYAATFSSALTSLVGAPRVLQRLASDHIMPFLGSVVAELGLLTSAAAQSPVRRTFMFVAVLVVRFQTTLPWCGNETGRPFAAMWCLPLWHAAAFSSVLCYVAGTMPGRDTPCAGCR